MTTADRLAEIRARADAATEGPWFQGRVGRRYESHRDVYSKREPEEPDSCDIATYVNSAEDAEFIAHAREDVPYLLAEVEQLRSLVPECTCGPWHPDMDGPDEECPQHGRSYREWIDRGDRLAATVARVRALADDWQAYGDNAMKSAIARQGMGDEQDLRNYAGLMWQRSRDLTAAIEGTDS